MSANSLSSFSTCEISDALIKLGLPHGGHIPDIHFMSSSGSIPKSICGPAYTVQVVLASDQDAPRIKEHFVDTAKEGSVIVIAAPERQLIVLSIFVYNFYRLVLLF